MSCFFISSCKIQKRIPEGEFLLTKVDIQTEGKAVEQEQISSIIKQTPNRKAGRLIRFNLRTYFFVNKGKEGWLKRTIKKTSIPEAPVLLDNDLTERSTEQIGIYLRKKGFFNSAISDTTIYNEDKRTAQVTYQIRERKPYTIKDISFSCHPNILKPLKAATKNGKTLLRKGAQYDVAVFEKERIRLTKEFKNMGYYNFSKEYINFEMDSSIKGNFIHAKLLVRNPVVKHATKSGKDTLIEQEHQIYHIKNVYVNTNFQNNIRKKKSSFTLHHDSIHFVNASELQFKPSIFIEAIFIKPNRIYNAQNVAYTQSRIAALKTFRSIDIQFSKSDHSQDNKNWLDCYINLTPSPKQSISIETEGTNQAGNLGLAFNLNYQNKNAFKGAEVFQLKPFVGFESQVITGVDEESSISNLTGLNQGLPFNTFETGFESNLLIPRFILPTKLKHILPKYYNPATSFHVVYNRQIRSDFKRDVINFSYDYSSNSSEKIKHIVSPLDVSLVNITTEQSFEDRLNELTNPFLLNSFRDHLIIANKYTFIFSNQETNKSKNYTQFRTTLENGGNLLRLLNNALGSPTDSTGSYFLFRNQDLIYAQYLKGDFELKLHNIINRYSQMAYRAYFGIGIPLKNFNVLPFEKSFFAGGANGIRSWQARSLGPGSYKGEVDNSIDNIGDIKIEANLEYRFDIFKMLEGATFVDVGNIWLLNEDPARPNANLDFSRILDEIAVGTGLGLRLDLSFFIIRIDAGFPLNFPALQKGNRWFYQPKDDYETIYGTTYRFKPVWNFGIGYPF